MRAFYRPGPSKIELSPAWRASFHKISVIGSGWILMDFWQVFGGVLALKSMRKSIEKIIKLFIDLFYGFLSENGGLGEPKCLQKSTSKIK